MLILYWILAAAAVVVVLALFAARPRPTAPADPAPEQEQERVRPGQRDLGANINPSATGNQVDLWPDRTGAQTRCELGALDTNDMTFTGDRPEPKQPPHTSP